MRQLKISRELKQKKRYKTRSLKIKKNPKNCELKHDIKIGFW